MGEKRGTKALEHWCRRMIEEYEDVRVDNMTTSWRDGRAFCALVCKCASIRKLPSNLIEFDKLKRENIYENNELAFRLAEEYFNIPSLLDPHDMVKYEVPDKLSVLTYLSQFYQVFGTYEFSSKAKDTTTETTNKEANKKPQPPPQMAQSVVPQRKPCFACKNQVFFAERLVINSCLYHRTCFKCARCHSVMNIGNFYETENENEYCCETCPDEEKLSIKSVVDSVSNDDVSETDNNDESLNVLKQSLSDEQKSANLNIQSNDSIEEQNIFSSDVNNEDEDENDDEEFSNLYESIKNQNENGENDISNEIETIINTTDTVKNVSVISEFIFENENENENENESENELENVKNEVETVCEDDKVCENEEIKEVKEVVKIEEDEVVKEDEILPAPTPSDTDNHELTESTINDNNEIITNSEIDIKLCENDIEIDISQLHEEEENSIETSTQDDSKYEKIINNTNQEHEQSSTSAQEEAPIPMKSLNPFDEDDDEEEEEIIQEKNKSQTIKYNKTLNPFGDDSDDDEIAQVNDSIKLHRHEQERSLSRNSRNESTLTLNKKKKAPLPPQVKNIEIANQQNELPQTPNKVLKKKRQAPTPPVSDQKKDQVQLRRKISIDENLQSIDYERNVVATDDMRKRKLTPFDDQKLGVTQNSHSELEKDKDEKDISNLNLRFSTDMSLNDNQTSSSALNKSTDGRWKRRKDRAAPIPGFAQPQRRILQMLPMQEIRQELEKIEIQQQGLEKQGVTLEKMIRERCEGADDNRTTEELLAEKENGIESKNPKEVDELIIQLFELVNEKNELFRRQAELMYLRREHRLEEEQADVEFEIRKLLSQPENNKTDHDKAREEALIQRLVEIVALRDEIVNCLDRDRLREFEEDKSIKNRLKSHVEQLENSKFDTLSSTSSLSKKEKKKLKESKKLKNSKNAKYDDDKDYDTTEIKKKKKGIRLFKRSHKDKE